MSEIKCWCIECGSSNVKINWIRNDKDVIQHCDNVECLDCGHKEPYDKIAKLCNRLLEMLSSIWEKAGIDFCNKTVTKEKEK